MRRTSVTIRPGRDHTALDARATRSEISFGKQPFCSRSSTATPAWRSRRDAAWRRDRRPPARGLRSARPAPGHAGPSRTARVIASICCSPPLSDRASHPRAFLQPGEDLEQLGGRQALAAGVQARDGDVLGNGQGAEQPAALGHERSPRAWRPRRRCSRGGLGRPGVSSRSSRGATPHTARARVDLPAPLSPDDGHHLTGAAPRARRPAAPPRPVRGPQVDDLKHGALPGRSRRAPRSRGSGPASPHRRPRRGEGR